MKKKLVVVLTVLTMLAAAIPVAGKELSNVNNAGTTDVEADILDPDSGDVSYIIAIPEKIDFGTLQMPEAADSEGTSLHERRVGFEVSAVEIHGLNESTQRVAVLMCDAGTGTNVFQINGMSNNNTGKSLEYKVLTATGNDVTSGTRYPNGYLFAAFNATGQKVDGMLSLDQDQLLKDKVIKNWAGDYFGKINFYTAIANVADYL